LVHHVREQNAHRDCAPVPIIILSMRSNDTGAHDGNDIADRIFRMTKPVQPPRLRRRLIDLLDADTAQPSSTENETSMFDQDLATRHPLRIVVVEDNVVNQKVASRLLHQLGYRTDVATNGLEAIDAVQRQPYDLVLMDVQMPEMDGLEATRRIRADERISQPRIVAMTAAVMHGEKQRCLDAGMDGYLSKPLDVPELVEAVKAASCYQRWEGEPL